MLPASLLAILRCPRSKQALVYFPRGEQDESEDAGFLLCPSSRLRYRLEAGVPVLLVEEATELDGRTVEALVSRARELGLITSTTTA